MKKEYKVSCSFEEGDLVLTIKALDENRAFALANRLYPDTYLTINTMEK